MKGALAEMKDQLRGCVKISAEGRQLYRFINQIHDSRICCFGQYCRKDVFYGEIYRRDLPHVTEMAEELGIELKSREYRTVSSVMLRYRRRIGLLIGLIIAFSAAIYFSSVVVTIDIMGNTTVPDEDILAALADMDIKPGTPLRDIDFHICENELRIRVDGISWAGIRHTGNRVVVEVTEIVPKPEMLRDRVPCNIVSSHEADITYTSVLDGMLMHKVGDHVPAGELLISGIVGYGNGNTYLHHARGEIRGEYEETVTFSAPRAETVRVPTGRTKKQRHLRLFSLEIPLYIGSNDYDDFNETYSESSIGLFGKELPIGMNSTYIEETEPIVTEYSDAEFEDILREKMFLYEKNFLSGDTVIISRDIQKKLTDDGMSYAVTYRIEENICESREIFIKDRDAVPNGR